MESHVSSIDVSVLTKVKINRFKILGFLLFAVLKASNMPSDSFLIHQIVHAEDLVLTKMIKLQFVGTIVISLLGKGLMLMKYSSDNTILIPKSHFHFEKHLMSPVMYLRSMES